MKSLEVTQHDNLNILGREREREKERRKEEEGEEEEGGGRKGDEC